MDMEILVVYEERMRSGECFDFPSVKCQWGHLAQWHIQDGVGGGYYPHDLPEEIFSPSNIACIMYLFLLQTVETQCTVYQWSVHKHRKTGMLRSVRRDQSSRMMLLALLCIINVHSRSNHHEFNHLSLTNKSVKPFKYHQNQSF